MTALLRSLHALAVAAWFGSAVFFTAAGLLIFGAFEGVSGAAAGERPAWFPLPAEYAGPPPGPGFPDPLRLEQGRRAAGLAVRPLFPFYFGLQAGCGVVALLSALALRGGGAAHGLRAALAALALATALGGWWLEGEVTRLRGPRDGLTDALLRAPTPSPGQVEEARAARAAFGRWHGYSLMQNFATLLLVTGLTLLVPALPHAAKPRP